MELLDGMAQSRIEKVVLGLVRGEEWAREAVRRAHTRSQGWDADLKMEKGRWRIWLSRVTGKIEVEIYTGERWERLAA